MSSESTESWQVLRRRVQLIGLLQSHQLSRLDAAKRLGVGKRTIERDIDWLAVHGVPLECSRASVIDHTIYAIPARWNSQKWLWQLVGG